MIRAFRDHIIGHGKKRSPHWPKVRRDHLEKHESCAACGSTKSLEVHHIKPFHLFPDLELSPSNLVTLCEGGPSNCHYLVGHLLNWSSYNVDAVEDAARWLDRIKHRPTG